MKLKLCIILLTILLGGLLFPCDKNGNNADTIYKEIDAEDLSLSNGHNTNKDTISGSFTKKEDESSEIEYINISNDLTSDIVIHNDANAASTLWMKARIIMPPKCLFI